MKLLVFSLFAWTMVSVTHGQGGTPPLYPVKVTVTHDRWPTETGWVLSSHPDGETYLYQIAGMVQTQGQTVVRTANLPPGDYHFEITDQGGDGICCNFGFGSYEIEVQGQKISKNGQFFSEEMFDFNIGYGGHLTMPAPVGHTGGNGQGGGTTTSYKVEYFLQVEYGIHPYETEVKVQLMDPRTTLELWPAGAVPANNFRMGALKNLMYGHEHRLVLTDNIGDGMPGGFADVALYVNDVWCQDLVTIHGNDQAFKKKRRLKFHVPTEAEAIARCCRGRC